MNLHEIVAPCVAAVNPMVTADWQRSTGATKNADYSRSPSYAAAVPIQVQMQALTYKDLMQLSGININGEARAMYVSANVQGVNRPDGRGGDIFTLSDQSVWLAAHILENWNSTSGWTKVAVVKQVP